jgi:hypothetical protein
MHKHFWLDCKKNLSRKLKETLPNFNNYYIYAIGHDFLLLPPNVSFTKNQNICITLGNNLFKEFVANYFMIAKKNGSIKKESVRLFLYAYISHHILDAYLHPFITHFDGNYLPNENKESWTHGIIENLLDAYLIEKFEHENPVKYKIHKAFAVKRKFNVDFSNTLESAIQKTYNIKGVAKKITRPIWALQDFLHLGRYDPLGYKKAFYRLGNYVFKFNCKGFSFSANVDHTEAHKYFNDEREMWTNPFDDTVTSDKSLWDLYQDALSETVRTITTLEEYIDNLCFDTDEIKSLVPDISSVTGLPCGRKLDFIK